MVMGQTFRWWGINGICDNRAIWIDVGLSKGCGDGLPEVLEISGNSGLRILTANPLYQNKGFKKRFGLIWGHNIKAFSVSTTAIGITLAIFVRDLL
ncbi:hypothetical protein JHK87_044463 [Glycine soja]|nr:hypothetical protein JHK87_044463 [Glycine soja]